MDECSVVVAIADAVGSTQLMLRFVIVCVSIQSHMDLVHLDDDTKRAFEERLCYEIHVCIHCTHNCR